MHNFESKVSVVIPCYNQARFLSHAIQSVRAQSHANWECLIINDGSTDNTRSAALKFASTDGRIRYVEQSNQGASAARNKGLDCATGQYIQFLDADDRISPDKFERQLSAIRELEGLAVVYCDYKRDSSSTDEAGGMSQMPYLQPVYGEAPLFVQLARDWETRVSIPAHCFLFDSRIFSEYGIRFDTELPTHEDWDCWMRIARLPVRVLYCDDKMAIYHYSRKSMSQCARAMRSGFLCAIRKQMNIHRDNPEALRILEEKRLETIRCYADCTWYRRIAAQWRRSIKQAARRYLPLKMQSFIRSVLRQSPS